MIDRQAARDNLRLVLRLVVDGLGDILPEFKRRDPREPDRRAKEAAEDALMLFLLRHWRKQEKRVKERMQGIKAPMVDDIFADDPEDLAELIRLLIKNAKNGIALFGATTGIGIDYTLTNTQAAEWARKYAGKLIRDIDKTSLDAVRNAVQQFVETPSFTLADLANLLPFDEQRAFSIAVTETTRSYAQGQLMAGEEMRSQFPDVKVVKRWYTNNDDRVCELCGPLDGVEVALDENFYEPESDYEDGNPPRHVACRCWTDTTTDIEAS